MVCEIETKLDTAATSVDGEDVFCFAVSAAVGRFSVGMSHGGSLDSLKLNWIRKLLAKLCYRNIDISAIFVLRVEILKLGCCPVPGSDAL